MMSQPSGLISDSTKLARARELFKEMIDDSEEFMRVTEEDLVEIKKIGRQTKEFWIEDKKTQMAVWQGYQDAIIITYDVIEGYIGKHHRGCEALKADMDVAFDKAQWSQKRYDAYCARYIASFH